jgi:membrane protein YdbS with pleckstrin-like domain
MDHIRNENGTPTTIEKQEERSHIKHIVFVHLTRLVWLALTVVVILLLTILIRNLTSSAGFIVEQQINVIAVIVGLALVAIVYSLGIIRMLRKIREWEHQGKTTLATGGLLGLGITPILMALPIVLMFLIH